MDIVSILTDMPVAGGVDAAAPAPIMGSDAPPPFADLLLMPDAANVPATLPAMSPAAFLPGGGKDLPVIRQPVAAEAEGAPSPATGGEAEDDGGADADPMWLPLSLDLPTVTARSPTPMATPVIVAVEGAASSAPPVTETQIQDARPAETKAACPDTDGDDAAVPSPLAAGRPFAPAARAMAPIAPAIAPEAAETLPASPGPAEHRVPDMVTSTLGAAARAASGGSPQVVDPVPAVPMPAGGATSLVAPVVATAGTTVVAPMPPSGLSLAPSPQMPPIPPATGAIDGSLPEGISGFQPPLSAPTQSVSPVAAPAVMTTPADPAPRDIVMTAGDRPVPGVRDAAVSAAPIVAAASSPAERTAAQPVASDSPQAPAPVAVAAAPIGIAAAPAVEAPRAPSPQTPVLDTGRAEWLDTLVDRIEEARSTGPVRVTHMKLLPDALGALDVRIRLEGERVHVTFTTDSPEARAIIADAAPKLAEMAEARGVRLGQTQVDLGAGAGGGGQQRAAGGRDADLPAAPPSVRRDEAKPETETATGRPRATRGRLA